MSSRVNDSFDNFLLFLITFKDKTHMPYAVPSWYSGITRAIRGHSPLASIEYERPIITMQTYGFRKVKVSNP